MNLRVQPGLAHSRQTLDAFLILSRPPLPSPAMVRRVQPIPHRLPGWNCVPNSLQGHQLMANSQVTQTMHRPIQPCDQAPSLLETCLFRHCRRRIFELPRISHPLALPAAKLRVAPEPAPPITPSDEVPGCPESCIFRPCRRWTFELPRISHPSAASALKLRVTPSLRSSSAAFR
jgi:hypothetical protein